MKMLSLQFILASFFSFNLFAQTTLNSPRATFKSFLQNMKQYKLGNEEALAPALKTLDTSELDPKTRTISARIAALKLVNTLDRLEYISYESIPNTMDEDIWVYRKKEVTIDGVSLPVEISIAKNKDNKWLFTPATLSTIYDFERAVKSRKVVEGVTAYDSWKEQLKRKMPKWTGKKSLVLLNGQWIGLFLLIFIAFIIERIVSIYLTGFIVKRLAKKGLVVTKELNKSFTLPVGIILFTILWSIGVRLLEIDDHVLSWFLRGSQVLFTLGCVMAVYQLVDFLCLFLQKRADESENKFDDILVPLIRKSLKTFVVAVGIIAVGDSLALDMKGLLAGMGIAGLGVSLAAKDTLSNLFGSLTVLLDRPFRIGDWVNIDSKVEGTVEEVGLRSCRIRTFYNSLITIPNGMLTNAHIDNYGMRSYRRFTTMVSVQYDTPPKKIEAFCEGIRNLIKEHPATRKDYFHVYLNGMGAHSLDILLYVFFISPDWSQEMQDRHQLLIDILRLGKRMGVEFAFPTQTLHLVNGEATSYDSLPENEKIKNYAKELAQEVGSKPLNERHHRSDVNNLN